MTGDFMRFKKVFAFGMSLCILISSIQSFAYNRLYVIVDSQDLNAFQFITGGDGNAATYNYDLKYDGQHSVMLNSAHGSSLSAIGMYNVGERKEKALFSCETFLYAEEWNSNLSGAVQLEISGVDAYANKTELANIDVMQNNIYHRVNSNIVGQQSLIVKPHNKWISLKTANFEIPSQMQRIEIHLKLKSPGLPAKIYFDTLKILSDDKNVVLSNREPKYVFAEKDEYAVANKFFCDELVNDYSFGWNILNNNNRSKFESSRESGEGIHIKSDTVSDFGLWQIVTLKNYIYEPKFSDQHRELDFLNENYNYMRPEIGDKVGAKLKATADKDVKPDDEFSCSVYVYGTTTALERIILSSKTVHLFTKDRTEEMVTDFDEMEGCILPDIVYLTIFIHFENIPKGVNILLNEFALYKKGDLSADSLDEIAQKYNSTVEQRVYNRTQPLDSVDVTQSPYFADYTETLLSTPAIQKAINDMHAKGGGVLYFPPGTYRTTTIFLKSNVWLWLDDGAVLQASRIQDDWKQKTLPVIYGENVKNVRVCGKGIIDGGQSTYRTEVWVDYSNKSYVSGNLPHFCLRFMDSENIIIEGITLRNACGWNQHFDNCEYLTVRNVTVRSPIWKSLEFTDGIDINGCRHVLLENLDIQTGDDGICLKNINMMDKTNTRAPMYDVVIKNSVVASTCNGVKIGTETYGDIYNVRFENIQIKNHVSRDSRVRECVGAIVVESVDHNHVKDITFENFVIEDCDTPLFIAVQNRLSNVPGGSIGTVSDIVFKNIYCKKSTRASQFNTEDGGIIKNVLLENITIYNHEPKPINIPIPIARPFKNKYPEARNYGRMPAYGLFARDVTNLELRGDNKFYDLGDSGRCELWFENVVLKK
ncbi:MAG: glycosyl hydrolase family 28 protein [Firmicutes bacterium]|nr:glycosyl hydrolase family 28 protein [Bacillota bacterium]